VGGGLQAVVGMEAAVELNLGDGMGRIL